MIIHTIFYYLFFTSAVLVYGIGLKKSMTVSIFEKPLVHCIETLVVSSITTVLSYLITVYLLAPLKLVELYPIVIILFLLVFTLLESLITSHFTNISLLDVCMTFPAILIAVSESYSMLSSLVIAICCCFSYYLMVVLIFSLKERIKSTNPKMELRTGALILISVGIIIVALYSVNVSWILYWR